MDDHTRQQRESLEHLMGAQLLTTTPNDTDAQQHSEPEEAAAVTNTTMPRSNSVKSASSKASDGEDDKSVTKNTPAESNTPPELENFEPGMTADYKQLYSGKEDKRKFIFEKDCNVVKKIHILTPPGGRFQWETELPKDIGKPAEDAESEKWAIIVRRVKVYNDPKKVLSMHSILVQSPLLKELLADVLAGYPGVTVTLKRLEFSGRFEPLIHRWNDLSAAVDELKQKKKDGETGHMINERIEHADLLNDLLHQEFADVRSAMTDMTNHGVITYDYLWTLFEPAALIYSKQENQDRAMRVFSTKYGADRNQQPCFWLTCQYIDFDGTKFGTNKLNLSIPEFEGTRPIASLSALPIEYHNDSEQMKAKLIERGGKVEALAGSHYRNYNGIGWRLGYMGNKDKTTVKGRIVVDTRGWNRFNPDQAVLVTPLSAPGSIPGKAIKHDALKTTVRLAGGGGDLNFDFDDGGMPVDGFFDDEETANQPALTSDQKMICSPLVRGYALKEKVWLNLFVNAVADVAFDENAFESLVIPQDQKEMILGLTTIKQSYNSHFDDFISGKGRGIIILLCGPPGVGKTLTAESVAEKMKVPLFMMSAGDLGLDPSTVESKLQDVLEMCSRWNAILLLDEADVFLEERSLHELERNKLVTIFLRVLEYYEGIMFLTTNRVQTFDQAFQSRIHISLKYEELDAASRKAIWTSFLEKHDTAQVAAREAGKVGGAGEQSGSSKDTASAEEKEKRERLHLSRTQHHAMTAADVRLLSQEALNGRQIKNVLRMAQYTAAGKGEALGRAHVEQVLKGGQFLHGANQVSQAAKSSYFA